MENIICLAECTSTNDYIRNRLSELADGTAVTALVQTNGRGRRGHTWLADSGMLPLSILLKNPVEGETLTARAGLSVCTALESVCGISEIRIKWPNDIIIAGKKVCGILCEGCLNGDNSYVICGIGVNVSQSEEFFKTANLPNGASLAMLCGTIPERDVLIKAIVENVKRFAAMPFVDCLDDFRSRVLNIGKTVRLIENGKERIATAVDVSPNGFLVCEDDNGRFEVNSGEVSVRGENGYL